MKKIYIIFIFLFGISISCTDKFEEFNTDTKKPTEVPGDFLFANAQKALTDQVASTNVNLNIWKLIAQYWTETTYTDEANYDIINRTIPDLIFRTYYRDVLIDFKEAKKVLSAEIVSGEEATIAKANKLLIIDMLNAYCYNRMVDIFGMVPYTEALDIDNISPVYDEGSAIYEAMINSVAAAVAGLDADFGSFGQNDLFFHGDVEMWQKFGNSLLVKMGITLADFNATLAQSTVEGAYEGAFAPGELCELVYLGGSNSNPLYVDLVQSGRHDFIPANTIIDMMNDLNDPRRPAYFTEFEGEYKGGIYGESNSFSQHSHIADEIQESTFPITLLDGIEVSFYLAEAAERGYSVGGDAETHYNAAISASFDHWDIEDVGAYLGKAEVAYSTAAGDWKQKIGTQAYIAYYIRGLVGWNSWRRLDQPTLNLPPAPETADGEVPKRFTFPVNEQTLNGANYSTAAAAIGPLGDVMHQKVFWDIN